MPQRPVIHLNLKKPAGRKDYEKLLSSLSSDAIQNNVQPLLELKFNYDFKVSPDTGEVSKLFQSVKKASDFRKLKKHQLIDIALAFSADINNSLALTVDPAIRHLWEELIDNIYLDNKKVEKILGRKSVFELTNSTWDKRVVSSIILCGISFNVYGSYYIYRSTDISRISYYLPPRIRRLAITHLRGAEGLEPRFSASLPVDTSLRIFNGVPSLPNALKYLYGTYISGKLPDSYSPVSYTRATSIGKRMATDEFPVPKSIPLDWPTRSSILVMAYTFFMSTIKSGDDIERMNEARFARFVFNDLAPKIYCSSFGVLFPEFTSFTKSWSESPNIAIVTEVIQSLVASADTDEWLDISNIVLRFLTFSSDDIIIYGSPYPKLFSDSNEQRSTIDYRSARDKRFNDWWTSFDRPFIMRWIKLLAACGILEIAVDMNAPEDDPLESLRYVKLTPLGKYAAGFTDKYTSTADAELKNAFDIDNINHIITTIQPNSPFEPFLAEISDRIGGNRFKISPRSLVRASYDSNNLSAIILKFKKVVNIDPSDGWQELFDDAKARMRCQRTIKDRYSIIPLDDTVPGLIDFIASNAEINENCLKAEQTILLVPNTFSSRFSEILAKEGFRL